jgi:hypothetical protein
LQAVVLRGPAPEQWISVTCPRLFIHDADEPVGLHQFQVCAPKAFASRMGHFDLHSERPTSSAPQAAPKSPLRLHRRIHVEPGQTNRTPPPQPSSFSRLARPVRASKDSQCHLASGEHCNVQSAWQVPRAIGIDKFASVLDRNPRRPSDCPTKPLPIDRGRSYLAQASSSSFITLVIVIPTGPKKHRRGLHLSLHLSLRTWTCTVFPLGTGGFGLGSHVRQSVACGWSPGALANRSYPIKPCFLQNSCFHSDSLLPSSSLS